MDSKIRTSGSGSGFKLVGFPKEFEKQFWESLDKRYYSILLITFLFMYSFAFFLASRDWQLSQEDLDKLKRRVIEMVYETEIITEPDVLEEELDLTVLETGGGAEEDIGEEGEQRASESTTERLQRQQRSRVGRADATRKMEQDVASSGILAIATAAGGVGSGGVEYGDVLQGLSGAGITDVGQIVKGTSGIIAASSASDRTRIAKGGSYRGSGDGIGIDDMINGQAVAGGTSFKRRGDVQLGGDVELTGSAAGSASRDAQSILAVINQNKTSVEYCYSKQLKLNPGLGGEIQLEIVIAPEGKVSSVRILRSTLGEKKLESCITRTIKRWRGFGKIDPSLGKVRTRFKYIF